MPFDETSNQYFDTFQTTPDANVSLTDGQTFGHDAYANGAFDHSLADSYQTDHFAPENQWDNSGMDPSANQAADSTPDGSFSDDANNYLNTDVPNDTFAPPYEHQLHSSFASATDVYVSGDIDHYHHIVKPNSPDYSGGGGDESSSNSSLSDDHVSSPEPTNCVDANNDGQCDSSSSGDGGSCGSSDND